MTPTRQEMLDSINMKMARTWWGASVWETGYYLPVMIGDVLDWIEYKFDSKERVASNVWLAHREYLRDSEKQEEEINKVIWKWKNKREPLSAQDDDCISYIYNLVSHE